MQAYERAKAGVAPADRLTLGTNRRSSPEYVEAINAFYETAGRKFGPEDSHTSIAYERVNAAGRDDVLCTANGSRIERPLVLHVLDPESKATNLEVAALQACASRIVEVLSPGGYTLIDKPLQPDDIAVLLPGHGQIAKLAHMLKARGVPCATQSNDSVFSTATARDLQLIVHAVLHPDDPRALRAALATRICGGDLATLHAMRHGQERLDAVARDVHAWHHLLERRGPQAVIGALMDAHAARLLQSIEGERILTDLRHLGELLQQAWEDCGSGERLSSWFAHQVAGGEGASEAAETRALRLESDAGRVKLMTLHASKGLEFPVVFLPLMWKHAKFGGNKVKLLADDTGIAKHIVLDAAEPLVEQQEYEERFRMLYVALTRAIHACHLFLLPRDGVLAKAVINARKVKGVALNAIDARLLDGDMRDGIARIAGWEVRDGLVYSRVEPIIEPVVRALPVAPAGPLPMRHSFSTLSGGGRRRMVDEEGAAEDEALVDQAEQAEGIITQSQPLETATSHGALDALANIAGADFGNAVHAIFEHRVPGSPMHGQEALVRGALMEFGVRPRGGDTESLVAPLVERVQAVLDTPLGSVDGPRLVDLSAETMRAELEFNYALDAVSLRRLREACEHHGEHGLVPARGQTLAGLMNGKIDLVFAQGGRFHVLDYKGNQLGGAESSLEDYAPVALEHKMHATGYRFQALLYTVAVERYLRERIGDAYRRDQHLGDCWYLFIRAVGLHLPDGTPCGVWQHRFNDALLDAVQDVLSTDQAMEDAA